MSSCANARGQIRRKAGRAWHLNFWLSKNSLTGLYGSKLLAMLPLHDGVEWHRDELFNTRSVKQRQSSWESLLKRFCSILSKKRVVFCVENRYKQTKPSNQQKTTAKKQENIPTPILTEFHNVCPHLKFEIRRFFLYTKFYHTWQQLQI